MFLLRDKLITQGEKRETSTKTCNDTMLHDKLRIFVSRISPPLGIFARISKFHSFHETKQTQNEVERFFSTTWPDLVSNTFATVGEF